jgi:hypothetical protein
MNKPKKNAPKSLIAGCGWNRGFWHSRSDRSQDLI